MAVIARVRGDESPSIARYVQLTSLFGALSLSCPASDFCASRRRSGLQIGDLRWPR